MFAEPPGFDRSALAALIGVPEPALSYVPVGFGTHHYRAGALFINVDVPADERGPAALEKAMGTAAALAAAGLEFVPAPRPFPDGRYVAELPGGYAVTVFGVIEGRSFSYGDVPDDLRIPVLAALGRIHSTPVPAGLPNRDRLLIPYRDELGLALAALDTPWTGGPFAEEARRLLAGAVGAVERLFARFDRLVPAVRAGAWVVTHGEPHAGNVMVAADGGIRLIDWDTCALAPRERDLWMIAPRDAAEWAAYGAAPAADPDAMELYRLRWDLADICAFVRDLRSPHTDDEDTRIAIRALSGYLAPGI